MEQRILRLLEVVREKDMELRALRIGLRTYLEDLVNFKYGELVGQILLFKGANYELLFTRAIKVVDSYDGTSFNYSDEGEDQSQGADNKIWMVSVFLPLTPGGKTKQDAKSVALRTQIKTYATSALLSGYAGREEGVLTLRHDSTHLFTMADGTKQKPVNYRTHSGISRIQ